MPSDRIRQDEMSGDLGPDYLKGGRPGVTGSDMGGQSFGQSGYGQGGYGQAGFGGGSDEEPPRRSRLLPLVIAFFALAAFAGIVWYAYEWGVGEVEPEHLPVVQAPSGPIKEKPEEPGGLEVPYTDSAVLNRSEEGDSQASRVESLLPPPEEPAKVPAAPAASEPEPQRAQQPASEPAIPAREVEPETAPETTSETADAAAEAPASEPAADASGASEAPPAPEAVAELPELPRADSAETTPAAEPAEAAPEAPAEPAASEAAADGEPAGQPAAVEPAPEPAAEAPAAEPAAEAAPEPAVQAREAPAEVAPGSWVVQLAALRQEEAARREWARIQDDNRGLLGSMSLLLEQADLGERGTFYRIQTGPLPNRATALDLCAQLKAAGQDCIAKQR